MATTTAPDDSTLAYTSTRSLPDFGWSPVDGLLDGEPAASQESEKLPPLPDFGWSPVESILDTEPTGNGEAAATPPPPPAEYKIGGATPPPPPPDFTLGGATLIGLADRSPAPTREDQPPPEIAITPDFFARAGRRRHR